MYFAKKNIKKTWSDFLSKLMSDAEKQTALQELIKENPWKLTRTKTLKDLDLTLSKMCVDRSSSVGRVHGF